MALSIKTAEADELARLTGETITEAVTLALRERLPYERTRRETETALPAWLAGWPRELRVAYDARPVSRREWDTAAGDAG